MLIKSFRKSLIAVVIGCATSFAFTSVSVAADSVQLDDGQDQPKSESLKDNGKKDTSRCYSYFPGCNGSDAQRNLVPIQLFEPTYILPAYYTLAPNYAKFPATSNPSGQKLNKTSFKFQLSLLWTLWPKMFGYPVSFNASYTQRNYWQVYVKSAWFNSTNYKPALFFSTHVFKNLYVHLGAMHQSNGRGGDYERSWNRAFMNFLFYGDNWMVSIKPWMLIFKPSSSDLHNRDISHYLGHGRLLVAFKLGDKMSLSLMSRNNLESRLKRGAEEVEFSYKLYDHFSLFAQAFSGYGQTLLSYDHYTNALGIGVSFNEWV